MQAKEFGHCGGSMLEISPSENFMEHSTKAQGGESLEKVFVVVVVVIYSSQIRKYSVDKSLQHHLTFSFIVAFMDRWVD